MTTHDQNPHEPPNTRESGSVGHGEGFESDWTSRLRSLLQAGWQEARNIAVVTFRHIQLWTTMFWIEGQRRVCLWRINCQKIEIGERMRESGHGDEDLREQISALDHSIQNAKNNKQLMRQISQSRRAMLLRLADSLTGTSGETVVLNLQRFKSLERQRVTLEDTRRLLRETPKPSHDEWTRIGVGYGVSMLLFVVVFGALLSRSTSVTIANSSQPEIQLVEADNTLPPLSPSEVDSADSLSVPLKNDRNAREQVQSYLGMIDEDAGTSTTAMPSVEAPRLLDSHGDLSNDAESADVAFTQARGSHSTRPDARVMTWIKKLDNGTTAQRQDAAASLAEIRPKDVNANVIGALSRAILDADEQVVELSAFALGRIGEGGVTPLINGLQFGNSTMREACAVGLIEAGQPAAEELVKLLSRNKKTSSTAGGILVRIGGPAVPELIKALEDDRVQVRGLALLSLGQIGKEAQDAAPHVHKLLSDGHWGIRQAAEEVLAKISP